MVKSAHEQGIAAADNVIAAQAVNCSAAEAVIYDCIGRRQVNQFHNTTQLDPSPSLSIISTLYFYLVILVSINQINSLVFFTFSTEQEGEESILSIPVPEETITR